MSRLPVLKQVVLDATDIRGLAEFYRELLGLSYPPGQETPTPGEDWLNLCDAGRPCLAIQQVDELPRSTWPDPAVPQQLHLDLTVDSVEALNREHERALGLGARLLLDESDDPHEPIRVYADPAGHPFCLFVA